MASSPDSEAPCPCSESTPTPEDSHGDSSCCGCSTLNPSTPGEEIPQQGGAALTSSEKLELKTPLYLSLYTPEILVTFWFLERAPEVVNAKAVPRSVAPDTDHDGSAIYLQTQVFRI